MILLVLAILLSVILLPLAFIYQIFYLLFKGGIIRLYLHRIAYSIDQLGNVVGSALFNSLLIKKNGYKFGNPDETISSVLGKNKEKKNLLPLGILLSKFLNKIDENHVEKSIEENP